MLKMVDGTGIIGVDMICPLGISTPQPPNYDRVELEGAGMLVLPNSLDAPLERLELGGKTAQVTTTGAQLFEAKNAELNKWVDSTGIIATVGRNCIFRLNVKPNTVYQVNILSASCTFSFSQFSKENVFLERTVFSKGTKSFKCTTTENVDYAYFLIGGTVDNINGIINDVMLYEGEEYKNYEPYTGGKPSPSLEYEQEVKNTGKWNEGTQKYEISVTMNNSGYLQKGSYYKRIRPLRLEKGKTYRLYVSNKSEIVNAFILNEEKTFTDGGTLYNYGYYTKKLTVPNKTGVISGECMLQQMLNPGYVFTVTADGLFLYQGVNNPSLDTDSAYITYDVIKTVNGDEPYTEQTLTITSDRPITKWDRLVEQGGQIGWLYKHRIVNDLSALVKDSEPIYGKDGEKYFSVSLQGALFNYDYNKIYSVAGLSTKDSKIHYVPKPILQSAVIYVSDTDTIMTAKEHMHYKVIYETIESQFVPLPQSEQNAIRALKTYYPTTVITADGGELDPDIKVTYRKEI